MIITLFFSLLTLYLEIGLVYSWPLWAIPPAPAPTNCNHYRGMPVNECGFVSAQSSTQSFGYYCIDENTIEYRDFYGPNCDERHIVTSNTLQCGDYCECSLENQCDSTDIFYKWCDENGNRVDHSKVIVDQCVTVSLTTSYSYVCNENGHVGQIFYSENADCSGESQLSYLPDSCESDNQYAASCV
eukprot:95078_1